MFENKDVYWISFIVGFKHTSTQSVLRLFHNQSIQQEIVCDSIVKMVDIPLEHQDDITFNFDSKDGNACHFFGIGVTKKRAIKNRKYFNILLGKSVIYGGKFDQLDYWGTMFEEKYMYFYNTYPKKLNPKDSEVQFKFKLKLCRNTKNQEYWTNEVDQNVYIAVNCYWIANFRPGIACFYRKNKPTGFPRLQIYNDVSFDLHNNTVTMTKFNTDVVSIPSDQLYGFKKITNHTEYLNFIRNSLFLLPGILRHDKQFEENIRVDNLQ